MAKKVQGYVELEWTCPNCGNENGGSVRVCGTCGTPQPADVEFHQARVQRLIEDEEKLKLAKAGADIQCAYCGGRNPATFKSCSQCGSDLSEGAQREIGRVVGAFKPGPAGSIECENCGTHNAGTRTICHNCGAALPVVKSAAAPALTESPKAAPKAKSGVSPGLIAGILVACISVAALGWFLFLRTSDLVAPVVDVEWQRSIAVEALGPDERDDWQDQLPADAENISCTEKERNTISSPPLDGNYEEVCGTPYTVDTGGGFGEVQQDCEYIVYENFCSYTVLDWVVFDTATLTGVNLNPNWPSPALAFEQRLGEESESYTCIFAASGQTYRYDTEDLNIFLSCQIGASFTLSINTLGAVVSIEP